jgi:hypothetical protein
MFASGLGLAILMALMTSRTLDLVDAGHLAARFANSVSTSAITSVSKSFSGSGNAVTNGAAMIDAQDLREAIEELTAKGLSDDGATEASAEGGTAIYALRPIEETSSIGTEDPGNSGGPQKSIQRRAKSVAQRGSSNNYHQVPKGTEKMFDANWQSKAFAYE